MSDELTVHLFEDPIADGDFRIKNREGEKLRTLLVDRGNDLVTQARLVGITHGSLAGGDDEPATLLVFEFRFVPTGGRRFIRATTTLRFEDSAGKTDQDPEVLSILPAGSFALNRTERVQTISLGVNAGGNASLGPAGLEAGVVWEMGETRQREHYTALSGVKRLMRKGWSGAENVAVWKLEENQDKNDGIPTFMRTAVLLRRVDDVPFTFTIKVRTDVDFVGEVKTLFGLERKDPIDPVEIDPGQLPKTGRGNGRVASLDPRKHDLAQLDTIFKQVADVVVATPLDGTNLATGTDGRN